MLTRMSEADWDVVLRVFRAVRSRRDRGGRHSDILPTSRSYLYGFMISFIVITLILKPACVSGSEPWVACGV